ncbi:MAG: HK97 family phage prohead protease [Deltaproteobacteria bacterium]|nr:HK97 family phage prohead protease [Deltaproteobacteria bacterium]
MKLKIKMEKKPLDKREKRFMPFAPTLETREVNGEKKTFIVGRGVPFNSRSKRINDWFYEEINPEALDNTDLEDMISTYNHSLNNYLGRMANTTLKIEKKDDGLWYEVQVPNTETGRMVTELLERGDIQGSSFIFDINEGGSEWKKLDDDSELRIVKDIRRIYEMGPVLNPAYVESTAEVARRDHDDFYKDEKPEGGDQEEESKEPIKRNIARRRLELQKRKLKF